MEETGVTTKPATLLELLDRAVQEHDMAVVGSPSNTTEVTIDILEKSETSRVLGQLVYLVMPQGQENVVILGQISKVETKNRWHEDLTFRGIVKRSGTIPHLSGTADVRTATISVQACFRIAPDDSDRISVQEDVLAISPTTGLPVCRVRDDVLTELLRKHSNQIIYLGRVYGTDVRMPFWLRHFGEPDKGGLGDASHVGIFGRTGCGKSGLAAYMLLGYARHQQMSILVIDPQGQFASAYGLPFNLSSEVQAIGRNVRVYRLLSQVRLPPDYDLFLRLLDMQGFFGRLGIIHKDNRERAMNECKRILKSTVGKAEQLESPPSGLLKTVLECLAGDATAISRIYSGREYQERLRATLQEHLGDPSRLQELEEPMWQPVLDLFMRTDSGGNQRIHLNALVYECLAWDPKGQRATGRPKPVFILNTSPEGTAFAPQKRELITALILRQLTDTFLWIGRVEFEHGRQLNCLVALDEAHYYARARRADESDEILDLTQSFISATRTTRKYGIGFMFITQTLASLHPEILGQMRLSAFGCGLAMGSEYARLEDMVDKQALSLYRSFVDPQVQHQYPFMFTGPASPLSFTGAPLFVHVFTDFDDFREANPWLQGSQASDVLGPPAGPRTPGGQGRFAIAP